METITVKNINPKVAGVNSRDVMKMDADATLPMCRIFGVLEGSKTFVDKKSGEDRQVLKGEFRAISPDGTKNYESDSLFTFKALDEKLLTTLKAGGGIAVEFGYDISVKQNGKSITGYEYVAKTLIATAASNRLFALAKHLEGIAPLQIAAAPAVAETPTVDTKKKK